VLEADSALELDDSALEVDDSVLKGDAPAQEDTVVVSVDVTVEVTPLALGTVVVEVTVLAAAPLTRLVTVGVYWTVLVEVASLVEVLLTVCVTIAGVSMQEHTALINDAALDCSWANLEESRGSTLLLIGAAAGQAVTVSTVEVVTVAVVGAAVLHCFSNSP